MVPFSFPLYTAGSSISCVMTAEKLMKNKIVFVSVEDEEKSAEYILLYFGDVQSQ